MRLIQVIGLICAFMGILLIFGESMTLPSRKLLIGDLMLTAAAVIWGSTTVLIYQLAVSAVVLPLGSFAMGEAGVIKITPLSMEVYA
jgi:drug/metabolite transporter (DMT)-like permease